MTKTVLIAIIIVLLPACNNPLSKKDVPSANIAKNSKIIKADLTAETVQESQKTKTLDYKQEPVLNIIKALFNDYQIDNRSQKSLADIKVNLLAQNKYPRHILRTLAANLNIQIIILPTHKKVVIYDNL